MFSQLLHDGLVGNGAGRGPEDEAQVEVEGISSVILVLQADRVAQDLLAEHGSEGYIGE